MKPDLDAAVDFMVKWCSPTASPAVLTAMEPDGAGIETRAFTSAEDVRTSVERWQGMGWNVYFAVGVDGREPNTIYSKARRSDISAAVALHADVDSSYKAGEDREAVLRALTEGAQPPTVVVDSGNGFNCLWLLREHVVLDAQEVVDAVEARNRGLAEAFGGDAVHDVSRVLRLPGTVNYPNAAKRARGLVPVMSRLVLFEPERRYELEAFRPASLPAQLAAVGDVVIESPDPEAVHALQPRLRELVTVGTVVGMTAPGDGSRSAWAWLAALWLARAGWSVGAVAGVLLEGPWGVQDKPNPEREAVRTASRAAQVVARGAGRFDGLGDDDE